ncbi:UMTA, variant [Blastomyces dermatitidis ER-3]|uniref:UMTA n=2 Tax=Ajellomyces dermatitidis TaxID=5039 RepID=F2TPM2_AJEDA|nr:UMTA [Blastomyces dermatitidis ER-3]XP_045281674.1 UMTA, variant [Blastomyces dermatitidis ER-3]EGE85185.2 UMTA [Blastomyces dermatitidis ATCC 18188]EQL27996.1 hypothetical protein BDFG_09209 [Blastomyces dermatitidis ATCC 26199]EQL27997.1 hypothetical protein, variant [Blastomyces dermatitidis ATCC 26199]KMW68562.1 UMTA, variant [Blastomyces dermatitidis ATCC 18188]OAT01946.1 UMTA [Blastomyces dermatitidis ER-3]
MAETEAPPAVPAIAAEDREHDNLVVDPTIDDSDSTYGDELSVYTASVTSSVTDYQKENGRRYHAYKEGRYMLPNDEQENERLDMHHALIRVTMKDKLFLAPIGDAPGRVIDICTGTGIWAIEFADLFPSAEVIGNDLSPIQPKLVPPNVKFIIDDVEDEWGYENDPFDFIHARYLTGGVKNMPRLLEQAFACLKPGGWAEFQDWDAMVQSADGTTKGTSIERYFTSTLPAFEMAGYITRPGIYLEKWMKDAGFVNVQVHKHLVPVGTWAKDKHFKTVGAYNLLQFEESLEGSAVAALTRIGNWSKEEVDILIAKTKQDARNPKIHSLFHFYVVYGQKPKN